MCNNISIIQSYVCNYTYIILYSVQVTCVLYSIKLTYLERKGRERAAHVHLFSIGIVCSKEEGKEEMNEPNEKTLPISIVLYTIGMVQTGECD